MPTLIETPTIIEAVGTKPKQIEEFVGRVNSGHDRVSVARMVSPEGWQEPGQRPEFQEITVVLRGTLRVEHAGGVLLIGAGAGLPPSGAPRACGRRHFYGPLPVGSLLAAKSDRLLLGPDYSCRCAVHL